MEVPMMKQALSDVRVHARPQSSRQWVFEAGKLPHSRPPSWIIPTGELVNTDPGLLKQVGPDATYPPRFHPYGIYQQRPPLQFTIQELDKCLYGKQELRVVQIGDRKATPPNMKAGTGGSSSGTEDKNKPAKWCDMCQEIRFGECPQHGPLPSLRPSLTLPGPKSYAISTFPDEVGLCISTLPLAGYGVFARHYIPMGTWIGPYEGKKIPVEEGLKQIRVGDAPFLWEIYDGIRLSHFLDASDENASSWMRFIQCARHRGEQNLFVFQYYGSIYYRAFKDIQVGNELLVWYDDKYPQYFGMPYDIRDMSNVSMESIQAPTELPKKSGDFESSSRSHHGEPVRPHHGDSVRTSSHPFLHGGKMIPSTMRERTEPPRIPTAAGHMHPRSHTQVTTSFQPPPAQPPTLSQAPGILDTRTVHSSAHVSSNRSHPAHPVVPHGHSPRPNGVNVSFRREPPNSTASMLRSMSADDLRKRNTPNMASVGDRVALLSSEREIVERGHPHPPGLISPHMNLSRGAMPHHYASKLPPSVMSVAPVGLEHSRLKLDELNKTNEMKLYHERERVAIERERLSRDPDRSRVPYELGLHETLSAGESWEIYRCQGCEQSFTQKSALDKHRCVSEASKPFQCGRCQLSFEELRHLQEHMAMHTSERPFKCGVCSRSFSGTNSLSAHIRSHTLNENIPMKEGHKTPIECQKCGKRFLQLADMNKHLSTPGDCIS